MNLEKVGKIVVEACLKQKEIHTLYFQAGSSTNLKYSFIFQ